MSFFRYCLLSVLLGTSMAQAGDTTIGNGGDLVRPHQGQYYLLDLFEVGLERNPFFDPAVPVNHEFTQRTQLALPVEKVTQGLVARKLSEIAAVDPLLGQALLRAMELLRWRMVNYELLNVPDEGTVYKGELFQAAIRQGLTVFLQADLWKSLNAKNKAALVLHELIYALYHPEELRSDQRVQRSYRVREINSLFFTPGWNQHPERLYLIVDSRLPTSGRSGFKEITKDTFFVAPMLAAQILSSYAVYPIKDLPGAGLIESDRVENFCQFFSTSQDWNVFFESYHFGLSAIQISLRRGSYNSPLGIMDFVEWVNFGGSRLPPYESNIGSFHRIPNNGERLQMRPEGKIFDFNGSNRDEETTAEAKRACILFMERNLEKYSGMLEGYR